MQEYRLVVLLEIGAPIPIPLIIIFKKVKDFEKVQMIEQLFRDWENSIRKANGELEKAKKFAELRTSRNGALINQYANTCCEEFEVEILNWRFKSANLKECLEMAYEKIKIVVNNVLQFEKWRRENAERNEGRQEE